MRLHDPNGSPLAPEDYEWYDENTSVQWHYFLQLIAETLADKGNVLGHVINCENVSQPRDMIPAEVAAWDDAVEDGDANALTGYTLRLHGPDSTTCNMANTEIIFTGYYPSNDFNTASELADLFEDIRNYNAMKAICVRETGVSTYTYSQQDQADHIRAVRNVCEEGEERIAGYCLWMSQDFNAITFSNGDPGEHEYYQAAFGLWDINGIPKLAADAWTDIQVVNPSFEQLGSNNRPEGWEDAWAENGSPSGWYACRTWLSPYDGSYILRMYTGSGAPDAVIYCAGDTVQCTPNTPLTVRAWMRYCLSSGCARLAVLEYDEDDNLTKWQENSFTGGNWTWKQNEISFITHEDTAYCYIRFGIGGEEEQYLDVDLEEDIITHQVPNMSFELDDNANGEPDGWEANWVWNGTRNGWYVLRKGPPATVVNGTYCFRMYTGSSGDAGARVICDSNKFHANSDRTYILKAYMRYELTGTATVDWWILEFDEDNTYLGVAGHQTFTGGNWTWDEKTMSFTTRANTAKLVVRFSAGSSANGVYFDVDWVRDYTP
jgi:hypothetical protein